MRIQNRNAILTKFSLSIIFLFGLNYYAFSQEYEFTLYYQDPCNNKTEYALNFSLEKDGIEFYPTFENGAAKLKTKGNYNLIHERQTIPITIDQEKNSHTIIISDIQEFIVTHDKHGYIFKACESSLNGDIIDYFGNGKVKFMGTFKNGHAIGFLTEFYANGEIRKIRLFDKEGYLIETILSNE
ncbi:hypothetical protein [Algoriphagus winogradskyi]|uniref:MORN repeat variant n=1 Tax=Algoriphagus winogradskyi TaxID=237017 RepID=A0ABY1P851_9BACT|nr:hypothetical protein [Algoriphagus winogradskyi]SMP27392.1 hypothetical protein SAMN06265367_10552 [Algoriphagus winogradskyi]